MSKNDSQFFSFYFVNKSNVEKKVFGFQRQIIFHKTIINGKVYQITNIRKEKSCIVLTSMSELKDIDDNEYPLYMANLDKIGSVLIKKENDYVGRLYMLN